MKGMKGIWQTREILFSYSKPNLPSVYNLSVYGIFAALYSFPRQGFTHLKRSQYSNSSKFTPYWISNNNCRWISYLVVKYPPTAHRYGAKYLVCLAFHRSYSSPQSTDPSFGLGAKNKKHKLNFEAVIHHRIHPPLESHRISVSKVDRLTDWFLPETNSFTGDARLFQDNEYIKCGLQSN